MVTSFLYHVTVGRGDPLAEQLTRSDSRILDTEIEDGGVVEKTGSAGEGKAIGNISALYVSLPLIRRDFMKSCAKPSEQERTPRGNRLFYFKKKKKKKKKRKVILFQLK